MRAHTDLDDVASASKLARCQLAALRAQVERLRDENERLQAELDDARELAAGMDDGGRVAAQEYATLRAACEEAESEWRDVAQEVKRQDAQIYALRADVERLQAERDDARKALQDIATIARTGRLAEHEHIDMWEAVRRLTLPWWLQLVREHARLEARRVLSEEG